LKEGKEVCEKHHAPKEICPFSKRESSTINTGAPITILFENNNTRSGDYENSAPFQDSVMPIL
jgi:hypothetical protein